MEDGDRVTRQFPALRLTAAGAAWLLYTQMKQIHCQADTDVIVTTLDNKVKQKSGAV